MANSVKMQIELDGKDALKTIAALQNSLKNTGKTAEKATKQASVFGDVLKAQLSSILAVNFGSLIKSQIQQAFNSFVDFEAGLINVAKTTGLTEKEVEALSRSIEAMARRLPVSTKELLAISASAGQLGVRGVKSISLFTETIAKLGKVSDLSGEVAATTLTRILNVTRESIDTIPAFASGVVALGNAFAATESEIARVTNEVARSSAQFGVSAGDAAALGATLRAFGVRAEEAGTVVGKAFLAIKNSIELGGSRLIQLEKITGSTGKELKKQFGEDAIGVFEKFLDGTRRMSKEGAVLTTEFQKIGLSGIRVQKVLPVLSENVDELRRAMSTYNIGSKDAVALNDEFGRASKSTASQIVLLDNAMDELSRTVGKKLTAAFELVAPLIIGASRLITESEESRYIRVTDDVVKLRSALGLLEKSLVEVNKDGKVSFFERDPADIIENIDEIRKKIGEISAAPVKEEIKKIEDELRSLQDIGAAESPVIAAIYGSPEERAKRVEELKATLANVKQLHNQHRQELRDSNKNQNELDLEVEQEKFDLLNELKLEQDEFAAEKKELDQEVKLEDQQIEFDDLVRILGEREAIREVARIQTISGEEKQAMALSKLRKKARDKEAKDAAAAARAKLAFEQNVGRQRIAMAGNISALVTEVLGTENKTAFIIAKAAALAQVIIGRGLALAMVPAQTSSIPYPANIAAAAQMTTLININAGLQAATIGAAAIKGFQDGGIVGGTSQVGDRQIIRANAGERILTARENRVLTEAIDENSLGGGGLTVNVNSPTLLNEEMVGDLIDAINDQVEFNNKELRAS